MQKTLLRVGLGLGLLMLVGAATAGALVIRAADVVVVTDGGFSPKTLPKKGYAPISVHGYGKIGTAKKGGGPPPVLEQLTLWFDKHGKVVTTGLPVCTKAKLEATTTRQAKKNCPDAIVGKGFGKAVVYFPEQAPIPASSPITIFNGPPKDGNPTVLAHAYLSVPAPTTYIVPIEIKKVHDGRYGFKTVAEVPNIAGGSGVPVYGRVEIGRQWTYKGKRYSYVNGSCPDGRLQAKGQFKFRDGTFLQGTVFKACKGR